MGLPGPRPTRRPYPRPARGLLLELTAEVFDPAGDDADAVNPLLYHGPEELAALRPLGYPDRELTD